MVYRKIRSNYRKCLFLKRNLKWTPIFNFDTPGLAFLGRPPSQRAQGTKIIRPRVRKAQSLGTTESNFFRCLASSASWGAYPLDQVAEYKARKNYKV